MLSFDVPHGSADHVAVTVAHRVPLTCFHDKAQALVDMRSHIPEPAVHVAHALPSRTHLTHLRSSAFLAGRAADYARASSFLDARTEAYASHTRSFLDARPEGDASHASSFLEHTTFKDNESVHLDSSGQPYVASDHDRKTTQLTVAGVVFFLMLSISGYCMFTSMRIQNEDEDTDRPASSR